MSCVGIWMPAQVAWFYPSLYDSLIPKLESFALTGHTRLHDVYGKCHFPKLSLKSEGMDPPPTHTHTPQTPPEALRSDRGDETFEPSQVSIT